MHRVFDAVQLIAKRHTLVGCVGRVHTIWGAHDRPWLLANNVLCSVNWTRNDACRLNRAIRLSPSFSLAKLRNEVVVGQIGLIEVGHVLVGADSARCIRLV